jgi:hypothetical protein
MRPPKGTFLQKIGFLGDIVFEQKMFKEQLTGHVYVDADA